MVNKNTYSVFAKTPIVCYTACMSKLKKILRVRITQEGLTYEEINNISLSIFGSVLGAVSQLHDRKSIEDGLSVGYVWSEREYEMAKPKIVITVEGTNIHHDDLHGIVASIESTLAEVMSTELDLILSEGDGRLIITYEYGIVKKGK